MNQDLPAPSLVGLPGFEPGTSASRTQRANQAAPQPVERNRYGDRFRTTVMLPDGGALVPRASGRRCSDGQAAGSGRLATTLAIRRLSISATRSSQPSTSSDSALGRDVPEAVEEEPSEGHVLALGQIDVQSVPHVVHAHPAVHQPPACRPPGPRRARRRDRIRRAGRRPGPRAGPSPSGPLRPRRARRPPRRRPAAGGASRPAPRGPAGTREPGTAGGAAGRCRSGPASAAADSRRTPARPPGSLSVAA